MTHSDKFRQRITNLRDRVGELQADASQTPPEADLLEKLLQQLADTLAELDVAEEELCEQSEMLDEAREALAREQQRYRQLFEFAPDAYIVTDLHGSIQRANLAAVQLLNLESAFLAHKPLIVFVAEEQRTQFRNALINLRSAGSLPVLELRLYPRYRDNAVIVLTKTTLVYDPDGKPSSIHWALVDISRQKALETELRKLNADLEQRVQERTLHLERTLQQKDELLRDVEAARAEAERANMLKMKLLAMVSHELRTPLTSIRGFASTLLATDVQWEPERWHSFVTIIDEEASRLSELVEQLLDVTRLQAGALSIRIMPGALSSPVNEALSLLRKPLTEHQLIIDLPPDLPLVAIDQRRITQVLVNLLGNSAKYSPKGTAIVVSAQAQSESVEVRVRDEGMGIPPGEREQVFEPFYQTEEGILKRVGTGLGLAICKGLIEQHGGKIWIADHDPPGTTVCFTLPLAQ